MKRRFTWMVSNLNIPRMKVHTKKCKIQAQERKLIGKVLSFKPVYVHHGIAPPFNHISEYCRCALLQVNGRQHILTFGPRKYLWNPLRSFTSLKTLEKYCSDYTEDYTKKMDLGVWCWGQKVVSELFLDNFCCLWYEIHSKINIITVPFNDVIIYDKAGWKQIINAQTFIFNYLIERIK